MEALAEAIGLRTLPLGARVINGLYREVHLILTALGTAAILRAPISQEPREGEGVARKKGHALGVAQSRRRSGRLTIVQLSKGHFTNDWC